MKKRRKMPLTMMLAVVGIMSIGLAACNADYPGGTSSQIPEAPSSSSEVPAQTPSQTPSAPANSEGENTSPFELFVYDLPAGYKKPAENAGELHEEKYNTYVYDESGVAGEATEATLYVYTPPGYDPEKEYNVLYLMHGGGENEGYWFGVGAYAEGQPKYQKAQIKYTTNVIDNMIANDICGDVIVVTPTISTNGTENFQFELKSDIIPFVEAKYATYAKGDVSPESLTATRDHRAYAGFSMGSLTGFQSIWKGSVDYMSYIGNFSGCAGVVEDEVRADFVASLLEKKNVDFLDYDIKYWYNGTGTKDTAEEDHLKGYSLILDQGGSFLQEGEDYANGDNCIMVNKPDKGHSYNGWIVDLYNVLNVFFKAS